MNIIFNDGKTLVKKCFLISNAIVDVIFGKLCSNNEGDAFMCAPLERTF